MSKANWTPGLNAARKLQSLGLCVTQPEDALADLIDRETAAPELYESHESLIDAIRALLAGKPVRDMDERLLRATKVRAKARGQNDETECSQ